MIQRARCVVRGNFQLAFLLALAAVAALGLLAAAALNERALEAAVEAAAFTAHPSFASSGELIWRALLTINLMAVGCSVLIACGAILGATWYLERLFRTLAEAVARLAGGQPTVRARAATPCWGGDLLRAFNAAAESLQRRDAKASALLEALSRLAGSDQPGWIAAMPERHRALRRLYTL